MTTRRTSALLKYALLGGGAAAGLGLSALLLMPRKSKRPPGLVPPRQGDIPFATVGNKLVWPVITDHSRSGDVSYRGVDGDVYGNWARMFGVPRSGGSRNHAGVDVYANAFDPVVAMSDGVVVDTQSFHLGSDAILVEHDDEVVLYGEVDADSWEEFGIEIGSKVKRGDQIARVACMRWSGNACKSHMLHLETYALGTRTNKRWYKGDAPAELRDPTDALLRASGSL